MSVDALIKKLEEHFFERESADLVEQRLRTCLRDGGAYTDGERPREGFCFVAMGPSRAGKSRAIYRAFQKIGPWQTSSGKPGRVFEVAVPSPVTSGSLALGIIAATNYETRGLARKTVPEVWRFTHNLLYRMGVDILMLEEAQNLAFATGTQPAAVGAALKARLQHPEWPISLILSGDERIDTILRADPHIRNRTRVVRFHPLAETGDLALLSDKLATYLQMAGLEASPCIQTREFAERLMVASNQLFAFACEHMVKAIAIALRAEQPSVTAGDFAEVVRERTGCRDDENVFLAERFHALQPDPPEDPGPRRWRR
ncbi:MAG: TniB family NTP-binding protein [Mangrovicoccus sp.]